MGGDGAGSEHGDGAGPFRKAKAGPAAADRADRCPLVRASPVSSIAREKARDTLFDAIALGMYRAGIRPNHLTFLQVPFFILMIWEGFRGNIVMFGIYQLAVIALDGMDGTLARRMGISSRFGAYLDAAFDLVGIVLIVAVAAHIHPRYQVWLVAVLVANLAIYLQNYLLDEKAVSYIRGPLVLGMFFEFMWPGIFWFGILIPFGSAAIIILVRTFVQPWEARGEEPPEGPPPYRPGFSLGRE